MSYSRLLDLRAEGSRVLRHVKPPRCEGAFKKASAFSWGRTQAKLCAPLLGNISVERNRKPANTIFTSADIFFASQMILYDRCRAESKNRRWSRRLQREERRAKQLSKQVTRQHCCIMGLSLVYSGLKTAGYIPSSCNVSSSRIHEKNTMYT